MFDVRLRRHIQRTHHPQSIGSRRHVQIDLRRRDVFMSQDLLDRPQIRSSFQQMRRETSSPQRPAASPLGRIIDD